MAIFQLLMAFTSAVYPTFCFPFLNSRPLIALLLSIVHVVGVALQAVFVAEVAAKVVSRYIQLTGNLFCLEHIGMLGNHSTYRLDVSNNQYSQKVFISPSGARTSARCHRCSLCDCVRVRNHGFRFLKKAVTSRAHRLYSPFAIPRKC